MERNLTEQVVKDNKFTMLACSALTLCCSCSLKVALLLMHAFYFTVPYTIPFDCTCKIRRAKLKVAIDYLCGQPNVVLSYIHSALAGNCAILEEKNWGSSVAMGIRCKDSQIVATLHDC